MNEIRDFMTYNGFYVFCFRIDDSLYCCHLYMNMF